MLSIRALFLTVFVAAAGQSVADAAADYESLRLVGAMREDERMLRSALVQKVQRTELSEQERRCLDRLEYSEITDIVASEIGRSLTAAEVRDAIAYFQSPSGRTVVKRELEGAAKVPLTTADQTALKKFQQRPAGRKLMRDLVLRNATASAEVMTRIDRHLKDCAIRRQTDMMRGVAKESCRARPVASSNNVCLATYTAEGSRSKPDRASVEVNCRNDGRLLTARTSLPKPEAPIALRWTGERELAILVDEEIKSSRPADSSIKVRFATRQKNDPPILECAPQPRAPATLAETLPPNVSVGAWRAYDRPGLCLMTARVLQSEVAGADGDMLLQFRRQIPAVPPFVTTGLALIVQIYQQREQPLQVEFGQKRLALLAYRPHQTHMLTGQTADTVLQGLRSKPLDLAVRRDGSPGYSIPLRRVDFDFAYAQFSECLAALGNSR